MFVGCVHFSHGCMSLMVGGFDDDGEGIVWILLMIDDRVCVVVWLRASA